MDEDDEFHDASEELPSEDAVQLDASQSTSSDSTLSHDHAPPSPVLRRRFSPVRKDLNLEPSSSSGGKRRKFYGNTIEEGESSLSQLDDSIVATTPGVSSGTTKGEPVGTELDPSRPGDESDESSSTSSLVNLAELMIRAVGFQIKLFINIFTFPLRLFYDLYMFVHDPFHIVCRSRNYITKWALELCGTVLESVKPYISDWIKEQRSIWDLLLKFGWGFLWASYVCVALCVLFVWAFVVSGVIMRYVVEEQIRMKEVLNFDYTKSSPVAFVPVISCSGIESKGKFGNMDEVGKSTSLASWRRVIPARHKLQATLMLTLPESDYNRNLGIFQVRLDFLSANGKVLISMSRPAILHYKSHPIRLLLTFFKIFPLVTGYSSEAQTLHVKIKGFTEGEVPTSCLKVVIEQRAEFRNKAGLPEVYAAALTLESELPLVKKLIWYWKKTLFIWIGMSLFMMELLFALLCCRPIFIPRVGIRNASSGRNALQDQNRSTLPG